MSLILYLTQIQIEPGAVRLLADECARTGITRPLVVTDAGGRYRIGVAPGQRLWVQVKSVALLETR